MSAIKCCGTCLFSEGGTKAEFKNGDINFWYYCNLFKRENDIVLLEYNDTNFVWENQKACEYYEPGNSILKKRSDLNREEYYFENEGHFQTISL